MDKPFFLGAGFIRPHLPFYAPKKYWDIYSREDIAIAEEIRTDGIVELVDICPTLCELAGIEPPKHLEGTSMAPLMNDPKRQWKKAAFTRYGNGHSVTASDYTYTEYGNNAQRMLYDRNKDSSENENVAEAEEYKEAANQLSKLLADGRE